MNALVLTYASLELAKRSNAYWREPRADAGPTRAVREAQPAAA